MRMKMQNDRLIWKHLLEYLMKLLYDFVFLAIYMSVWWVYKFRTMHSIAKSIIHLN